MKYEALKEVLYDGDVNGKPRIFVGREAELARWEESLRDPRGQALVVIGPPAMGKTALLDEIMKRALHHPDLKCGAVRYEITPSQGPDGIFELMMLNAFDAATVDAGSFDMTERNVNQWKALLKACRLDGIAELAASLKHDPAKPMREQLLARLEMLSKRMPDDGRAIFVIDPEKMMASGSADEWRLVVRDLPERITFVIAQRPEDSLATEHPLGEFWRLANVAPLTGTGHLESLGNDAVDAYASASHVEDIDAGELRAVLGRYGGHPFAIEAAVRLLHAGVRAEDLPSRSEPTVFAASQWELLKRDYGADAVRLIEAMAVLEVAAPIEVVQAVADVNPAAMKSVLAKPFVRGLVREEAEGLRLYHALFQEHVQQEVNVDREHRNGYHARALAIMRARLGMQTPDVFAALHLWRHVAIAEGTQQGSMAFLNECWPVLYQRGEFAAAETIGLSILEALDPKDVNGHGEAVLRGNLGILLETRGNLDEAEEMFQSSLQIHETLEDPLGIANQWGNLGNLYLKRGELIKSKECYERARDGHEAVANDLGVATALGGLGNILISREEWDEAERVFRTVLKTTMAANYEEGISRAYGSLGLVLMLSGDLDSAEAMIKEQLAIDERALRISGMASGYSNLATIFIKRGELEKAEAMLHQSLRIERQTGRLEGMAGDYGNLGIVKELQGDLDGARNMYKRSVDLYDRIGANHMVEDVQARIDEMAAEIDPQ